MSVLFLGKKNDLFAEKAHSLLTEYLENVQPLFLDRESSLDEVLKWEGDYIVSYLCPLVIPKSLISKAKIAAINFHPGSPQYPGIGCTNFALYNDETLFGVTCHYIDPKVDSGAIIAVKMFPVLAKDSVYSLTQRAYAHLFSIFSDVLVTLSHGEKPSTLKNIEWDRKPYTRQELDALCVIKADMTKEEVDRRIRATVFPGKPGPVIKIHGHYFKL